MSSRRCWAQCAGDGTRGVPINRGGTGAIVCSARTPVPNRSGILLLAWDEAVKSLGRHFDRSDSALLISHHLRPLLPSSHPAASPSSRIDPAPISAHPSWSELTPPKCPRPRSGPVRLRLRSRQTGSARAGNSRRNRLYPPVRPLLPRSSSQWLEYQECRRERERRN